MSTFSFEIVIDRPGSEMLPVVADDSIVEIERAARQTVQDMLPAGDGYTVRDLDPA